MTTKTMTDENKNVFAEFVKFYNLSKGTNFSTEEAMTDELVVNAFNFVMMQTPFSTRNASYRVFTEESANKVSKEVLRELRMAEEALSRSELAERLGRRLSTVCGQVANLKASGLVLVTGTKKDPETGMTVEVLEVA